MSHCLLESLNVRSLATLRKLELLNLSHNPTIKKIPEELRTLSKIETIDMRGNEKCDWPYARDMLNLKVDYELVSTTSSIALAPLSTTKRARYSMPVAAPPRQRRRSSRLGLS